MAESRQRIASHGLATGGRGSAEAFLTGVLDRIGRVGYNYGVSIYERDWDVLVVLDTCRPDLLSERSDTYEFIPAEIPTHTSLGSASIEWVKKNFTDNDYASPAIDQSTNGWYDEELSKTAYVTANLFAEHIDPSDLLLLDEVHKYGWDEQDCTTPPKTVTDRAISIGRNHDPNRLIVHYMQPHAPYRSMLEQYPQWREKPGAGDEGATHPAREMWEDLRHGEIAFETVWDAYRDNLDWVLQDGVRLLLSNLDAERVVLTSDHGEAFGRWGTGWANEWGTYAHPPYVPIRVLKEVPWVVTEATDEKTFEPAIDPEQEQVSKDERRERLEALGYA